MKKRQGYGKIQSTANIKHMVEKSEDPSEQQEQREEITPTQERTAEKQVEDIVTTIALFVDQLNEEDNDKRDNNDALAIMNGLSRALYTGYSFMKEKKELGKTSSFKNLYKWLQLGDIALAQDTESRMDKILTEKKWSEERSALMKKNMDIFTSTLIPRLEFNGQKDIAESLRAVVLAIEIKIKTDSD